MDITGGTMNSGGVFSPAHGKPVVYDPKNHRWAKPPTNFRPVATPINFPNQRYLNVRMNEF